MSWSVRRVWNNCKIPFLYHNKKKKKKTTEKGSIQVNISFLISTNKETTDPRGIFRWREKRWDLSLKKIRFHNFSHACENFQTLLDLFSQPPLIDSQSFSLCLFSFLGNVFFFWHCSYYLPLFRLDLDGLICHN
jgi:hypothetical protein